MHLVTLITINNHYTIWHNVFPHFPKELIFFLPSFRGIIFVVKIIMREHYQSGVAFALMRIIVDSDVTECSDTN